MPGQADVDSGHRVQNIKCLCSVTLHLDLQGLAANLVQKTGRALAKAGHVKMQSERYFSFVSPPHAGSLKTFLRF